MLKDTAGNSLRQAKGARLSSTNLTLRDRVGSGDRDDFYRLNLTSRSSFSATLTSTGANVDLNLIRDSNRNGQVDQGEVIASSRSPANASDSINQSDLMAGTYFVRVFTRGRNASYQLTLTTQLASSNSSTPVSSSFAEQIVQLTNTFRQQNGLQPLTVNAKLTTAAQTHSENMAFQDFYSHTSLDGSQPWDRMTTAGYQWSRAAENIAAGYTTPDAVFQAWIDSPGHLANIIDPNLKEIGVGYYNLVNDTGSVNWNVYWTQEFGSPLG